MTKEEKLASIEVGLKVQDKYGNTYEVIEGDKVRILNRTPFGKAGRVWKLRVDEQDGRVFIRSGAGAYDLFRTSGARLNKGGEVIEPKTAFYLKSGGKVGNKIKLLMSEGKPQKQAVAIALDYKRRGKL